MSKFNLRGKLTVTVHACRGLKDKNMVAKMDPFVELRVSNSSEKFKTRVVKDGHQNPVFDQSYLFNLVGKEELLHIVVWSEGALSDDHIGRMDLSLDAIDLSGGRRWYVLKDRADFSKQTGEVQLSAQFDGSGLPEHSVAYQTHQQRINGGGAAPVSPATPASAPPAVTTPQASAPAMPVPSPVAVAHSQPPPTATVSAPVVPPSGPAPYGSQPNYQMPPPQQQPMQQPQQPMYPQQQPMQQPMYASQPPPQQPMYGSQQPPMYAPQQPMQQPMYAPPQPQPVYAPPPQPVYVQQPVAQPVYQQPTVYAAPPAQVYVAAPPVQFAPAPVVFAQQTRPIIGYYPNGQPRYQ